MRGRRSLVAAWLMGVLMMWGRPGVCEADRGASEEDLNQAYVKACILFHLGRFDETLRECERILRVNPSDAKTTALRDDVWKTLRQRQKKEARNLQYGRTLKREEMLLELDRAVAEPPTRLEGEDLPASTVGTLPEEEAISDEMKEKLQQRVDLNMVEASLADVLTALFEMSQVNILADEELLKDKLLTVQVKALPLAEVLEYLARNFDLHFAVKGSAVWLTAPEEPPMETRIFPLSHGLVFGKKRMASRSSSFAAPSESSSGFSTGSSGGGGSSSSMGGITDSAGGGGGSGGDDREIDLTKPIEEIVDWPEGSAFVFDERTTSLIAVNTRENLDKVEEILQALDVDPIQILIESRFIEVSLTTMRELGIEWQTGVDLNKDGQISAEESTLPYNHTSDDKVRAQSLFDVVQDFGASALTFQWTKLNDPQLQMVLRALEEDADTDLLSAPKVTTLNNTLATIKLVQEYTYPSDYDVQSGYLSGGASDSTVNVDATVIPQSFMTREIGIILDVTPSVGKEMKTIALTLEPEISTPADPYEFTLGNYSFSQPQFNFQRVSTDMIVANGETIVMGGLIREKKSSSVKKIPILGDIPLLGWMFKRQDDSAEKKSLLIFVTAHLLSPGGNDYGTEESK